jgi:CDP-glucose 4,6-dehydratase
MIDARFWTDRRVFLTGHTGFKGSWMALWLARLGARTRGYALAPPASPNLHELIGANVAGTLGDVRDPAALSRALRDARPSIVFHFAAQPIVRESYRDPVGTYATNVMGLVHLFEAVRATPSVEAVVVVTSDKCYENREWVWGYREDEPMGGADPYSNSKGCAELIVRGYRSSFFASPDAPKIASARAGNVIGGGDWSADRLVPDITTAVFAGHAPVLRNPASVRPWQHVLEPLSGYLQLAQALVERGTAVAEGWNFGPGDEGTATVAEVSERLSRALGSDGAWVRDTAEALPESHVLRIDSSKARARLDWRPRLSASETVDWTAEWYLGWREGAAPLSLCVDQLQKYEMKR